MNDDVLDDATGQPEWRPPEELRGPTNSPLVNFVILVLSSRYSSNTVNEHVAVLLAEKERFTSWYLREAKVKFDEQRLLDLSDASIRLLEPCWTAWKIFVNLFGEGRSRPSGTDYQTLLDVLDSSAVEYSNLRGM